MSAGKNKRAIPDPLCELESDMNIITLSSRGDPPQPVEDTDCMDFTSSLEPHTEPTRSYLRDKGGAIVILDRAAYDREIQNQLSNSKFYRNLEQHPISSFKKRVHDLLDHLWLTGVWGCDGIKNVTQLCFSLRWTL
ncbi:hypothetical protein ABVT39_003746 [Epinephelus coioides]